MIYISDSVSFHIYDSDRQKDIFLRDSFRFSTLLMVVSGAEIMHEDKNNDNVCVDDIHCNLGIKLGPLSAVSIDWGDFKSQPIDVIREDRYNPGSFFINARTTIKKWTPGSPVTLLLGNETQEDVNKGYRDGPSNIAEFTIISDFVQFNRTKLAIGELVNACIRLYDFETDNVSTIVGVCDAHGRGIYPAADTWEEYDINTEKDSLSPQFSGILSILILEKWNKLLIVDYGYKIIIQHDFIRQKTKILDMGLYLQCPKPLHIISNANETEIFINHAYGLSKYNLQTKVITLLVGEIDGTLLGNLHLKLIPGPFHTAQTGSMDSLRWLVQDQVLVSMGRKDNEALVIIDLMQKQIYSVCSGQSSDHESYLYFHNFELFCLKQ